MSLDTKLIQLFNDRTYNPWKLQSNYQCYPWESSRSWNNLPCPEIPGCFQCSILDDDMWFGITVSLPPDPSSIVTIKHRRVQTSYDINREFPRRHVTSFYRVHRCFELDGSHPEQRDKVQSLIDEERSFKNDVIIIFDGTSIGRSITGDWAQGLRNKKLYIPVKMKTGEPRKLRDTLISDLLTTTISAFSQGRVSLPRTPSQDQRFLIDKLKAQLVTRPLGTDIQGRLKSIDDRDPGSKAYDLSVSLSLVIGYIDVQNSRFANAMLG